MHPARRSDRPRAPRAPFALAALFGLSVVAGPDPALAARPLPGTPSFGLVETTIDFSPTLPSPSFTCDLGTMFSVSGHDAIGATLLFRARLEGGESAPVLFGVRPRYRRWLTRNVSLDIGPGLAFSPPEGKAISFTAGLNFADLLILTGGYDAYRDGRPEGASSWYAGYRFGRWAAAIGAAIAAGIAISHVGETEYTPVRLP